VTKSEFYILKEENPWIDFGQPPISTKLKKVYVKKSFGVPK